MDILPTDQKMESLADDIIGVGNYEAAKPTKREFLPWHKPRKHFVRKTQWLNQIIAMVDEVMPQDNILKYLGLPGDDLLDLRYFHQNVCVPKNLKLRFLGFNFGVNTKSPRGTELAISKDEVSKLALVDPTSDILGDNISQIANQNSIAWQRSLKMGPYDVVNIDLCDGFGKQDVNQFEETHYSALSQILGLQSRRHNPWLLFLTTRTGTKHTDGGVLKRLTDLYSSNLESCQRFATASTEHYQIHDGSSLEAAITSSKGVSDVFLVALCKWIGSLCVGQAPPATVKVQNVFGYTVDDTVGHQDLISIALKIEPTFQAANDIIGLAQNVNNAIDECQIAFQVINKVATQKDVDTILADNAELRAIMIHESSELLKAARYDVGAYETWANAT